MDEKFMMTQDHAQKLPVIRLRKAVLQNFKSVEYGEIVFNAGKLGAASMDADILGIYGQNGSGKTSFIEALSILKQLMIGASVHENYADCVAMDADHATLTFSFDMLYPDHTTREAVYTFCLSREQRSNDEVEVTRDLSEEDDDDAQWMIKVFDEKLSLSWEEDGVRKNLQTIIDTASGSEVFVPVTKRRALAGSNRQQLLELEVNKKLAREKSQSFIFMRHTLQTFRAHDPQSLFLQTLLELRYYAYTNLFVVDSRSTGLIRLNVALPLYTTKGVIMLSLNKATPIAEQMYPKVQRQLEAVSTVLTKLVPGLTIDLKKVGQTLDRKGNAISKVMLMACRGDLEIPLRDESDGVRKIISVLSLIISAFNQDSVTVAIDEFDAGIFEYLLGELLQAMEESGRGQFIFTSHNLRPLEVISKKFLCFTTTNPENRYVRLKNVGASNNLRDVYFRELIMGEQDEELYNATKRYKIVGALKKAGAKL